MSVTQLSGCQSLFVILRGFVELGLECAEDKKEMAALALSCALIGAAFTVLDGLIVEL